MKTKFLATVIIIIAILLIDYFMQPMRKSELKNVGVKKKNKHKLWVWIDFFHKDNTVEILE